MDLSPYLRLLVEKKADSLYLKADEAPTLRLLGQEKAVGKVVVTADFLDQLVNEEFSEPQKLEIESYKKVRSSYHLIDLIFIVQAEKSSGEQLELLITLDKRTPSDSKNEEEVSEEGLELTLDLMPYLKLLVEKKADSLCLKVDSIPTFRLLDQEKSVGKFLVTANFLDKFVTNIFNESQKSVIESYKIARTPYHLIDLVFIVQAEKNIEGLEVLISLDKRIPSPREEREEIQVLGKQPDTSLDLLPYLYEMVKQDASDIFLTVDSSIKIKISGLAIPMDRYLLTPELTESAAFGIMTEEQQAEFVKTKDLDFAIALPDKSARFRVNAFYQRQSIGLVLRLIPSEIPKPVDLGLPAILLELILEKRGLLLMVGGTGSGKSTSLAAMINHRNENSRGHILTIEDPVEFSHPNLKSIVNQREVGTDTESYARALKACLREAPDVILIGEIRDKETMKAALELANTGHLCISTMHANNANQAMERIINMFPQIEHKQLFMDLATNMNAVISQRLIPTLEGKRCAAIEILINTPHISNLILKGELNEIKEAMSTSGGRGMKTFDDALFELFKSKKISLDEALRNADSRNDLEAKINFG